MISRMNRIEEIYLQFNALEFIPRSIGDLKRLRILKLGGNNLKALHPDIGRLDELEILSIWNNNISFLPREIGELVSLRGLALWGNPIARLPEEICNLRFLEILEINDMDQLVLSSSQVEWIRNLIANGCMVSIDEGLREIIDDDIPF